MVTSVAATIDDMTIKFKVAIIDEFSMQTMAEMMEEKTLLDRAFLTSFHPVHANGQESLKRVRMTVMNLYSKVMVRVPESTPKASLIADTNIMRKN